MSLEQQIMKDLEQSIGYSFQYPELIKIALTHSSYSNEHKGNRFFCKCNERLEFLGDSVLSLIISQYLYLHYPDMPEGDLTKIRAGVVCEKTLSKLAKKIKLGRFLFLGKGEERSQGRERSSILADAFEALLGALYLDGGFEAASAFLMPYMETEIDLFLSDKGNVHDYKTLLQQIIQQEQGEILEYVLVEESGPDHAKHFKMEARLNSNVIGVGEGVSKREAEQMAAKEALVLFGEERGE